MNTKTGSIPENTPVIIGAGQITLPVPDDITQALSHADIAAEASKLAILDASPDNDISIHIDTIAAVRTFADSFPAWSSPFGRPENFPGAIAARLGIRPVSCIYEIVGGQSPQKLVGEFSEKLYYGECGIVLLAGGEAIANIRAAERQGAVLDWNEKSDLPLENRGITGGDPLITRLEYEHGLMMPVQFYGLMENARRYSCGISPGDYLIQMAELFSSLSRIASQNPYAAFPAYRDPESLRTVTDKNPLLVSPYTKGLVSQDRVNQGAALLLTTVETARKLGVNENRLVFLHGYADCKEPVLLKRRILGRSPAMKAAIEGALDSAGIDSDSIDFFDLYSCFPIVVFNAREILDIDDNDPRPITLTGGLPYFGGPGNNYSMHAVVSMVWKLRENSESFGLVYANGGWMTKHSAGIYSAEPPAEAWKPSSSRLLQAEVDNNQAVEIEYRPHGRASVESFIINYSNGTPQSGLVIAKLENSVKRCIAVTAEQDSATLSRMIETDPAGKTVFVQFNPRGNIFAFTEEHLTEIAPHRKKGFSETYIYNRIERKDHILIVTINRPEVRNALNPPANDELEAIFDAFENDGDLRAAIITAEGDESFCTGNDLKYMANGGRIWFPETGFGGLTHRPGRRKPVIAAVNGSALGGGLEIALASDIIISSENAVFGLPEVRVGLIAMMGGIQRLTRQIGSRLANEMLFTGKPISAVRALEAGLVNYVVPRSDLIGKAIEIAQSISEASPVAVRCTIDIAHRSSEYASIDDAVAQHYDAIDLLLNSEDFYEGPRAFAGKRKPEWR